MSPDSHARRFDDSLLEDAIVASALRAGRLPNSRPPRTAAPTPVAPALATAANLYQAAYRLAVRDYELNRLFNPAPGETS